MLHHREAHTGGNWVGVLLGFHPAFTRHVLTFRSRNLNSLPLASVRVVYP